MRDINEIILHYSYSNFGNAALIDEWHRSRGWSGIGYHYVILNPYPNAESFRLHRPQFWLDGVVEIGRPLDAVGAHSYGFNTNSIGICLIGKELFTYQQFQSLATLISDLKNDFPEFKIYGHYELQDTSRPPKSCPNLDMDCVRKILG